MPATNNPRWLARAQLLIPRQVPNYLYGHLIPIDELRRIVETKSAVAVEMFKKAMNSGKR